MWVGGWDGGWGGGKCVIMGGEWWCFDYYYFKYFFYEKKGSIFNGSTKWEKEFQFFSTVYSMLFEFFFYFDHDRSK